MIKVQKYIFNYSLILISIFPIIGLKKSALTIIFFCVFSTYIFFSEKNYKLINSKDFINILILSSYYISLLVSYVFTENKVVISNLLEKSLCFLVFPLFLIINKSSISKETYKKCLIGFAYSNVGLALWVWYKIFLHGIIKSFEENNYYNPILRNIFNDISEIHLPYLGVFFVFSSLILLKDIFDSKKKQYSKHFIYIFFVLILVLSIFTFAARLALVLFFILFFLIIFSEIKTSNYKVILAILSLIIAIPLFSLSSVKNRIKEITEAKLILPSKGQSSDQVNFRYGIYNCDYILLKDNWLFGLGADKVQEKLNKCYSSYTYKNFDDFKNINYNTHNQYLDVLLKYGIFGLILFFIYLLWGIKNKLDIYKYFLFIVVMSMISENIFDRQVGIVFFNFFNTLFFVNYLKTNEKSPN